ncbi:hypothetical protein V6N12_025835 [Hibiscus sabdariffa]|uniref:Uncharacterized protein n=1 Tax=Hibiscus sabdariffa TaxID=183260 RepID=A0ABR2DQ00_9ROSI
MASQGSDTSASSQRANGQAMDTDATVAPVVSISSPREDTLLPVSSSAAIASRHTGLLNAGPSQGLDELSVSPCVRSPMLSDGVVPSAVGSSSQQLGSEDCPITNAIDLPMQHSPIASVGPSTSIGDLPNSLGVYVDQINPAQHGGTP